jgi:two-component system invasion response regulator UvrY
MKILLADDHAPIRQRLKQILLEAYPLSHIEEFADGDELLNRALDGDCDLVIADISMPELSGLEALRHIRARFPTLPVLLLSIYFDEDYSLHAVKAGASAYLCKEEAQDKLIQTVSRLIV